MMFEDAYSDYLKKHTKQRQGEALRRLMEGHGHAEKLFLQQVWWPAFGHFDRLYPEYEVHDYRDGVRYLDFAFLQSSHRLALEIDGFGPHWQKISRTQFSDQLARQNQLIIDGWKILRFSYDDVKERPRSCEQTLQQFMGRWFRGGAAVSAVGGLSSEEKDIIRATLSRSADQTITPKVVCLLLGVEQQKARRLLRGLVMKEVLKPAGRGRERIGIYRLAGNINADQLNL